MDNNADAGIMDAVPHQLNGGTVLEGEKKNLRCRGEGPQTKQWIVSPTGRSWRVMLGASA